MNRLRYAIPTESYIKKERKGITRKHVRENTKHTRAGEIDRENIGSQQAQIFTYRNGCISKNYVGF